MTQRQHQILKNIYKIKQFRTRSVSDVAAEWCRVRPAAFRAGRRLMPDSLTPV